MAITPVHSVADPILITQLQRLVASPTISASAISGYSANANATTMGVDLAFTLTSVTGINSITLLRSYTMDIGVATVVATWQPFLANYTWSDTDGGLQANGQVFYWLRLSPTGTSGTATTVGPQELLLNPALIAPAPPSNISASHAAAANGSVLVTVNVGGLSASGSVKIYVSNYKGNPSPVAVAQAAQSPVQFALQATGETVTFQAAAVSTGGGEALGVASAILVLSGPATVPATPQGITVVQIPAGNQISFQGSREAVTSYRVYRAQRGQTFLLANLLAVITASGSGTVEYLDTSGLSGDWVYFVIAAGAAGYSAPSTGVSPPSALSSAAIPPNSPSNTTNTATIDSIDSGSAVIVRVYGAGGPGTSYTRLTGYGSLTRPNGSLTGLLYSTAYAVLYTGTAYIATTSYAGTLPDGWEWVGTLTTTGPTGGDRLRRDGDACDQQHGPGDPSEPVHRRVVLQHRNGKHLWRRGLGCAGDSQRGRRRGDQLHGD